jgi:regulatory protein
MDEDKRKKKAPAKPKIGRKVDAAYLERAALYYLERFSTSSENLKRVLKRKIDRRCRTRKEEPEEFYPLIEPLVQRYIASGLINDEVYTQAQVASLRRRGASKRMIEAKLKSKGLESGRIEETIAEDPIDELDAAKHYTRRRKLGPWRTKNRKENYERDLAALGRAGFSYAHAKAALDDDNR